MSLKKIYEETELKKSTKAPKEFIRCWTAREWEQAKRYLQAQDEGKVHLVTRKVEIHRKNPDTPKNTIEKIEQQVLYYDR
jgi:hypothetical protein